MPKVEIFLAPGESIPDEFAKILNKRFDQRTHEKLKRFGGRVLLSVTAPYIDRKNQDDGLIIDSAFLSGLSGSPEEADEMVQMLTLKQVRELALLVDFPISSNAKVGDAKKALLTFLFSEDTWKKIAR
ncbi:MAG: hypothetical protein HQ556_10735 [Candidatus Marinimicrobia bacterium]|nr:hypothetical protein [Candidatus Neomarinimicrobiota bacterium]